MLIFFFLACFCMYLIVLRLFFVEYRCFALLPSPFTTQHHFIAHHYVVTYHRPCCLSFPLLFFITLLLVQVLTLLLPIALLLFVLNLFFILLPFFCGNGISPLAFNVQVACNQNIMETRTIPTFALQKHDFFFHFGLFVKFWFCFSCMVFLSFIGVCLYVLFRF